MTYIEWRDELDAHLSGVSDAERKRVLDYYSEAYADRREAGFSEREIIEMFGEPCAAASKILKDGERGDENKRDGREDKKRPLSTYSAARATEALHIDIGAHNLFIERFDGDRAEVTYPNHRAIKTQVEERDGRLFVKSRLLKRYCVFGFSLKRLPPVTVKLPRSASVDLNVNLGAGNVSVCDGKFAKVEIKVGAGNIKLGKTECETFVCDAQAGEIKMKELNCPDVKLSAKSGAAKIDGMQCGRLNAEVYAGSLKIDRLTCPAVDAEVYAGSIKMGVVGEESDYSVAVNTHAGSCNLANRVGTTGKYISARCAAGSINVKFCN